MDQTPQTSGAPSLNLIQQTVDKVLGWWDPIAHKQVPGLDTRMQIIETDISNFKRFLQKAIWVGAAVGGILVLKALGVPTEVIGRLLHLGGG